ncbi:MAG: translation initiation factor IF-3 [Candidatus Moranbacteria bacterium]|jgi:translation initiation factor IF-3|nr:translation initiation factor IF-3 [Candidatus Moranbacteria bacterium]
MYEKPRYRVNERIRIPLVSVIDEAGSHLGEMSSFDALTLARSKEMDLVEVSPNTRPPVCKIMDYGKFQYAQAKKSKSQTAQKKTETKGIRIGVRTDTHDLDFKKKQAEKFLSKGNKVKIEIRLRGREKAHQDLARKNLKDFSSSIETPHKIEEDAKRFPGGFNILIAPE